MTASGQQPRGRGNGLIAGAYVPVLECDPRLVDGVLAALARAGIAAYASPSTGRVGGYLDVQLPGRPLDRIYVDASLAEQAVELARIELPGDTDAILLAGRYRAAGLGRPGQADPAAPPDLDVDAAWADIVARYADSAAEPAGVLRERRVVPGPPAPLDHPLAHGRDDPLDDLLDADDHYEPPEPEPIPAPSPMLRWAILTLAIGIALLLAPLLPRLALSGDYQLAGMVAILAGVVMLVWQLHDRPSDSDDDNDGAVV